MKDSYKPILQDKEATGKAIEAVSSYLGKSEDDTADLIKLVRLNRAVAKRVLSCTETRMKPSEIDSFEKAYEDYAKQLENAVKSTFMDSVEAINATKLMDF